MGYLTYLIFALILIPMVYKRNLVKYHLKYTYKKLENNAFDNIDPELNLGFFHPFLASLPIGGLIVYLLMTGDNTPESNTLFSLCYLGAYGCILMYFESTGYIREIKYHLEKCCRYKKDFGKLDGAVLVLLKSRYKTNSPDQWMLEAHKITVTKHYGLDVANTQEIGEYYIKEKDGHFPTSDELNATLKKILFDTERGFGFTIIDPKKHTFDQKIQLEPFVGSPQNHTQIIMDVNDVDR